jgi:hypothetical protein
VRRSNILGSVFAAGIAILVTATTASADVVAEYNMEEQVGDTVLVDSGPNGLNGYIGSLVQRQVFIDTGDYGFTFSGPRDANDERLANVADNPLLDPGTLPYRVTVRFRTTNGADPNIVQKGQSGQTGGYWKVVLHKGWPRCHFRDYRGVTKAIGFVDKGFPDYVKAGDGKWHTLICERLADGVRATIDPGDPEGATNFISGSIGRIDNSRPLSIGGKTDCDQVTVGCDYFDGTIAWIRIERPVDVPAP